MKVKQEVSEINVKMVSPLNEQDQYFSVKRDEPLLKLIIRWSVKADVKDYRTCRFLIDGKRVDENKTPREVGLEDGDSIDVFMEQTGGRGGGSGVW